MIFLLSPKEQKAANRFSRRHEESCLGPLDALTGLPGEPHFQYRFVETGIGTKTEIKCLFCRHVADVTEYDSW